MAGISRGNTLQSCDIFYRCDKRFYRRSFVYLGKDISLFYKFTIEPLIWLLPKFDQSYNISKYIIDARLINTDFLLMTVAALAVKSIILLLVGFLIFARREIGEVIV